MIRKGTPALIFTPDRHIPTSALTSSEATGTWRLGRVTAWHKKGRARIVDSIDGVQVTILGGWTHTLAPGETVGVSIVPIDTRPEVRAMVGTTWTDGGAVFATLDPIRQLVISEARS